MIIIAMIRTAFYALIVTAALLALAVRTHAAGGAPGAGDRFEQALTDYREARYELASAGAREVARLFPGTKWEGRALFLAGRADAARGELEAAAAEFGLSKEKYPVLSGYADHELADAYLAAGMDAEAAPLYISVAKARPDGPLAGESLFKAGRALYAMENYSGAAGVLKTLVKDSPDRPTSAEALYLLAAAEAVTGALKEAFARYETLMLEYPESRFVKKAGETLSAFAGPEMPLPKPDAAGRLKRAETLSSMGLYSDAAGEYERAIGLLPDDDPGRGDALIGLGYSRYRARRNGPAIDTLLGIADSGRYPGRSPEALYWLARTYLRLGKDDRFRATAKRCAREYPGTIRAADCLLALGVELTYDGMYPEAEDVLKMLVDGYPRSEDHTDALWRLGWVKYLETDYRASERILKGLYESSPNSYNAARGMYWRARSLDALGEKDKAERLYKLLEANYGLSYYSVLAEKPGAPLVAGGKAEPHAEPPEGTPPVSRDEAFVRAAELGAVGLADYGVRELMKVERRYNSRAGLETLAYAYRALGEYKRPLEMAERVYRTRVRSGRSPVPDGAMRILFPDGYWDVITREAEAFGVDPYLVAALVREESHFDPRAVSPAGAMGLMQLMPRTAALVCRKLGRPKPTGESLRRGEYNLPLGVCHLGYLLEKHGGRIVYALAEYNAGPAALGRWKQRMPDASDDVFVENIGYPETRSYVRRVIRNYGIYRGLYGGSENAP